MADEEKKQPKQPAATVLPFKEEYPSTLLPTIFADGVANLAQGPHIMKFYLFRQEPSATGAGPYRNQVVTQIVMPVEGFVAMTAFFEKAIQNFIENGQIQREVWESARSFYKEQK
jgi:hypothetical protein